jgi:hypothetical protein
MEDVQHQIVLTIILRKKLLLHICNFETCAVVPSLIYPAIYVSFNIVPSIQRSLQLIYKVNS